MTPSMMAEIGIRAAEEILGKSALDFLQPEDREQASLSIDRAIRTRTPIELNLRHSHADGTYSGWNRW